jgi:hypothetical protein
MKPARVLSIVVAGVAMLGCSRVSTSSVPNTTGADRVWASANIFCARKPNALLCWEAAAGNPTSREPTLFDGVGTVAALQLRTGEGCAISDIGMGCFRIDGRQLVRGGSDVPRELVAFGPGRNTLCARGDDGVQCFSDKIENRKPYPMFERPRLIRGTLDGAGICAEYEQELRCYTADASGNLLPTLRVRGVRGVRGVRIQRDPAWIVVLDEGGLKFATPAAEAVAGRPLADDTEKSYPPRATVELESVKSVSDPKKLTADGSTVYVLDAEGVKAITLGSKGLEIALWPLAFRPEDFWQASGGAFFAAHQGELTMHGWKGGERYSKVVAGIKNPKDVAVGDLFTCIAHDRGVACLPNGT